MTLAEAFRRQSAACESLGSPFMARLMSLSADRLAADGAVGARLHAWAGDVGPTGASLPLRLAGALHALVLDGDAGLRAVYPPNDVDDETLWAAVERALDRHGARLTRWLDSPPQTNEVRRSAALIAGAHWLAAHYGLPVRLSELGASAGLNLMFDHFALQAGEVRLGPEDASVVLSPQWDGAAPPRGDLRVVERRGVDLNPVDPFSDEGRLRLRAYLWADQVDRRALTDAAIAIAAAEVDQDDAIDWLAGRLAPVRGQLHLVFHTVAWQYFPVETQERGERLLAEAGTRTPSDAPLARLGMEADGQAPGAAIWLDLWPEGRRVQLGRIDFHGRWVDWRGEGPT